MTRLASCRWCDQLVPQCTCADGPQSEEERGNCRACDGTGVITEDDYYSRDCSMCDGSGDYTPELRLANPKPEVK